MEESEQNPIDAVGTPLSANQLAAGQRIFVTKAVQVDILIQMSGEDLNLEGGVYFATDQYTWPRRWLFGLIKRDYHLRYGFIRGELHVDLVNAHAPLGHCYAPAMPESMEVTTTNTIEDKVGKGLTGGVDVGSAPKAAIGFQHEQTISSSEGESIRAQKVSIATKGKLNCPIWEFIAHDSKPLFGRTPAKGVVLAKLTQLQPEVVACARFWIDGADVGFFVGGGSDPVRRAVAAKGIVRDFNKRWRSGGWRNVAVAERIARFPPETPTGLKASRSLT